MFRLGFLNIGIIFLALFVGMAFAAEKGVIKIAVASIGAESDSMVSVFAGRALHYLIFDNKGVLLEAAENPGIGKVRRRGRISAKFLVQKEVTTVIAGDFGPAFSYILEGQGIQLKKKQGKVCEVINAELNITNACKKR